MLIRWALLCGALLVSLDLSAQADSRTATSPPKTEPSAQASTSATLVNPARQRLTATSQSSAGAPSSSAAPASPNPSSTGSAPGIAPVPQPENASPVSATASTAETSGPSTATPTAPRLPVPIAVAPMPQFVGSSTSSTADAQSITAPAVTRSSQTSSISAQAVANPAAQAPEKLQRGGSLLNQPLPSGAELPQPNDEHSALPPLRQILVAAADINTAEQQRRLLLEKGIRISARKNLAALGLVVSTFNLPDGIDADALLVQLGTEMAGVNVEQNQRFHLLSSDMKNYAHVMVGLRLPSPCQQSIRLAMLDSAVNTELPGLGRVRFHNIVSASVIEASSPLMKHGTAVASLLVSADSDFPGLLPRASLDAFNVFMLDHNGRAETRTDWLLSGLNKVAELSPAPLALNLSFGGDYSLLLDKAFTQLAKSMVLVAAGGNSGSSQPVYPAAYNSVYGVAAVDARGNKTTLSNFGDYISLRAPGEDIWTQSQQGKGFYAAGTSFAAPFATGALALATVAGMSIDDYLLSLDENKLVNYRSLCH